MPSHSYPPGAGGGGGGGGDGFSPARVLYAQVQPWPATANPLQYFSGVGAIAAALVQAATMAPSAASPVLIVAYPGTYTTALTLVSNVHLATATRRDVVITGPVTWTPGAGVNAAFAALREEVDLSYVVMTALLTIDATAKTAAQSILDARECGFRGGVTHTGRPALLPDDYFQVWNALMFGALSTFTNVNLNIFASSTDALTIAGNTAIDIRASECFNAISISGTANGEFDGCAIFGTVAIGAGTSVGFPGSVLKPGSVLTVAAGGFADVRSAEYTTAANLAGAGPIDRSIFRGRIGPTVAGPNPVVFATPYNDAAYNVHLTQTGGALGVVPIVIVVAPGQFTFIDPTGGNTFVWTILKE